MNVVGVDLSLTATGIADPAGCYVSRTPLKGMARLAWIRDAVLGFCLDVDLVVVEGYSFHSSDSGAHALGELGGVIRLALHEAGLAYMDVPPACLKQFATGKGNAAKDQVLAAAVRSGFDGDNNNAADAWWLRQIGLYPWREQQVTSCDYRAKVIDRLTWPVKPVPT